MTDIEKMIEGLIQNATVVLTRFERFLSQFEPPTGMKEKDAPYTRARGMSDEWDSPQKRMESMRHLLDDMEAQHLADINTMARLTSNNEQQAKEISRLLAENDELRSDYGELADGIEAREDELERLKRDIQRSDDIAHEPTSTAEGEADG